LQKKSRREEQKEKRRKEIVAMAIEVFAEKGFHSTDVQVIADRLQIGKGTVYRYFPSKNELFFGCLEYGVMQISQKLDTAMEAEADPIQGIAAGMYAYLNFFQENPALTEIFIQERAFFKEQKLQEYVLKHIDKQEEYIAGLEALIDEGILRKMPAQNIHAFADNLISGTMYNNYFREESPDIQRQVNDIMTIFLHGILNPNYKEETSSK